MPKPPVRAQEKRAFPTIFDPGDDRPDLTPLQGETFYWIFPALKRRAESCSPCGAKTILMRPSAFGAKNGPNLP
jgi:hypothetical protein